jgi:transposase
LTKRVAHTSIMGMYIRRISRRLASGKMASYLQLAQKVRDPKSGAPRDEVLYHFGPEDQVDRDQIRRLIVSLSRFLDPAERVGAEAVADGLAAADFRVERALGFGGSYVLDAVWRRLELDSTLHALLAHRSFEVEVERLLFAMVSSRALARRSKLGLERWVGRKVLIEGLDQVQVHTLYRAMDFLLKHAEELQRAVFFSVASLLNLEVDLLFFDTTSTYFEVEEEDGEEGLRRYGKSKDERDELPQVVIGLAVTREGIPVRCWVWPGNTADASTVKEVQEDLAGWRLNRVVWVLDRGFTGEEQRIALQRGGGHVLIGEKLRSSTQEHHPALRRAGRFQKVRDNVEVKEVTVANGSDVRRYVVVRNPEEAKRDREVRERMLARLETEVNRLNASRGRRKGKHSKAVCELLCKPSMRRYVRELGDGRLKIDRAVVRADEKLDGKYVILATDPSLSAEDVALGYRQLAEVERAFRTMKTTLDLRPLHHRLEDRIRSHVLLCWMGLLLVRVIENQSGMTWAAIREELDELTVTRLLSKDRRMEVVSNLTESQRNILQKLDIAPPKRVRRLAPTPSAA